MVKKGRKSPAYLRGWIKLKWQEGESNNSKDRTKREREQTHLTSACTVLAQRVGEEAITTIGWRKTCAHPVNWLLWCLSNAVSKADPNKGAKLAKQWPPHRNDPHTSLNVCNFNEESSGPSGVWDTSTDNRKVIDKQATSFVITSSQISSKLFNTGWRALHKGQQGTL